METRNHEVTSVDISYRSNGTRISLEVTAREAYLTPVPATVLTPALRDILREWLDDESGH